MKTFKLWHVRCEQNARDAIYVRFHDSLGNPLIIRMSVNGRLINIVYGHRTLHSREQAGKGGRKFRLPSEKVRQYHELAHKAVAFRALRGSVDSFPPQEIDL